MKLNRIERAFVNSPLRRAMQRLVVRWFAGVRPLAPGADTLEIGCGIGAGARMIAEVFSPGRLFLTDLDPTMIVRARRSLRDSPARPAGAWVGDAAALPLRGAAVDAVFGFGFLHHVPDWRRGLREVYRVLRPGGLYYMEEYYPAFYGNFITRRLAAHPEHDRFDGRDLRAGFAAAGLALGCALEIKHFGILGVGVKGAGA